MDPQWAGRGSSVDGARFGSGRGMDPQRAELWTLGEAPWTFAGLSESAPRVHSILLSVFVTLRMHLGLIDL